MNDKVKLRRPAPRTLNSVKPGLGGPSLSAFAPFCGRVNIDLVF